VLNGQGGPGFRECAKNFCKHWEISDDWLIAEATQRLSAGSYGAERINGMPKPPQATPHSDIDGVHEDEARNVDSANAAGQDSEDLAKAKEKSKGRPPASDDVMTRDDRAG
jgi:hypothetical protein